MTFTDWLRGTAQNLDEYGAVGGSVRSARELWMGVLRRMEPLRPAGDPVMARDWDVLLVLDACRVDLFREVAPEYDFVDGVGTHRSLAGYSREWLERNFTGDHARAYREELSRTAYVTGNPFSNQVFDCADGRYAHPFATVDEVWQYAWDGDAGTIHPRPLTDRAIRTWRAGDVDRMIVHYMQPHIPFVHGDGEWHEGFDPNRLAWGTREQPKDMWARYRDGELDATYDELWAAYRENLRYVLDDIEDPLLSNLDAGRVVLTADHGNAIGEAGFYGHGNVPLDSVTVVPWATASGVDTGSYRPAVEDEDAATATSVEDRLRDLGYVDG